MLFLVTGFEQWPCSFDSDYQDPLLTSLPDSTSDETPRNQSSEEAKVEAAVDAGEFDPHDLTTSLGSLIVGSSHYLDGCLHLHCQVS